MRLTVFNGSPRGSSSNTGILLEHFLNGFTETEGNSYESAYLNRVRSQDKFVEMFREADHVLLAFPLYTDAMPAMVKTFIESLQPLCRRQDNPSIGFIVQSGLQEAVHSRYVERYLKKLAGRLGCRLSGTIVRGGVEGIQVVPPMMTRRLFRSFHELGASYGKTGELDREIAHRLAKRERHNWLGRLMITLMTKLGMADAYWNGQLKKNGAFGRRFDRPYVDS